jgi:hypothetical protein
MKLTIVIIVIFSPFVIAAQNVQHVINDIISHHTVKRAVYKTAPAINEQSLTIFSTFGKPRLNMQGIAIDFDTVQVTGIDLVFTDYPSHDALTRLNTERFKNLFLQYPALAKNNSIAWQLIRQTDGAEKNAALGLFHGFVIYYRPLQNKATITSDLIKLKELLIPEGPLIKRNGFVARDTMELRKRYEIDEYTTVLKLPVNEALQLLDIEKEKTFYKDYDSLFVYLKPRQDTVPGTIIKPPADSTVVKVFDRMHWNNMLVVADVTASMYPYIGQLLYWLKQHEDERRIKQFVFFNDGDDKDDDQKIIGSTGGIYSTSSSVYEVIEQLVFKTMSNGNGGNIPENNIEALLKGSAACPGCSEIIMIADNSSRVSDMALLKQLHRPVHIILCGVHGVVHADYLNIARSTGGSVHLADEDVELSNVKEAEMIMINGRMYKFNNGKF